MRYKNAVMISERRGGSYEWHTIHVIDHRTILYKIKTGEDSICVKCDKDGVFSCF